MSKNEDLKYDFAIADSDIVDENKEIISDDEADVDDNMVFRAKAGDEKSLNHILRKYRNFVRSKAKPFFIVGADKEDILQEGMIGLFKAIRDYDEEKTHSNIVLSPMCDGLGQ